MLIQSQKQYCLTCFLCNIVTLVKEVYALEKCTRNLTLCITKNNNNIQEKSCVAKVHRNTRKRQHTYTASHKIQGTQVEIIIIIIILHLMIIVMYILCSFFLIFFLSHTANCFCLLCLST